MKRSVPSASVMNVMSMDLSFYASVLEFYCTGNSFSVRQLILSTRLKELQTLFGEVLTSWVGIFASGFTYHKKYLECGSLKHYFNCWTLLLLSKLIQTSQKLILPVVPCKTNIESNFISVIYTGISINQERITELD